MADVAGAMAVPACSTIPAATRFTRATGDCLRDVRLDEERLLPPLLLARLLELLLALLDELFRAPPLLALFDVVLRLPPLAAPLLALLLAPPFRPALFEAPFRAVLFDALFDAPLLAPPLRPLALLLALLLPLDLRMEDLVRGDAARLDDEREEPPVREPALRLELLRDDFFVAMLYSETGLSGRYVIPSKNRAQMLGAQD